MAFNRESVTASAEKLVAKGKIEGAIKEYKKLVAENPSPDIEARIALLEGLSEAVPETEPAESAAPTGENEG